MRILLLLVSLSCLGLAQDLREGERLYKFHCAFCHGKGDDGMAANLVSPQLVHAPTEEALLGIIRNGIPGSDMPASLGMSDSDIRSVAAYVRALGRSAPASVPGDVARGRELYMGKAGCAGCHMVAGKGGINGPDLSTIGIERAPASLRASIVAPDESIPPRWMRAVVKTKSGTTASGVLVNEDNFGIFLRAGNGRVQYIDKASVASIERGYTRSIMPSYAKTLSEAELTDVVAFLFSLRGER
jgi:putative heme-binding domain-containing protein